jgi:hypothetical protein
MQAVRYEKPPRVRYLRVSAASKGSTAIQLRSTKIPRFYSSSAAGYCAAFTPIRRAATRSRGLDDLIADARCDGFDVVMVFRFVRPAGSVSIS